MNDDEAIRCLGQFNATRSVGEAVLAVPSVPGLYGIHVDQLDRLPEPFSSKLRAKNSQLLYIGQASDSLRERLIEEELRHRRAATFFRGIGAVLGYRPPAGSLVGMRNQNNYWFSKWDTDAIVSWMATHLRVIWVELPREKLTAVEIAAVVKHRPLLNTKHNPDACAVLAALREACRNIARGAQAVDDRNAPQRGGGDQMETRA